MMLNFRSCLMMAALTLVSLGSLAAEPPPQTLKARQATTIPAANIRLDADATALFSTPAGAKLRDGWLKLFNQEVRTDREFGFSLSDLTHVILAARLQGSQINSFQVVVLLESEKTDLFAKLGAKMLQANGVVKSEDGRTLAMNQYSERFWMNGPQGVPGLCFVFAHDGRRNYDYADRGNRPLATLDCPIKLGGKPGSLANMMKEFGKGSMTLGVRCNYPIQNAMAEIGKDLQRKFDQDGNLLGLDWMFDLEGVVFSLEGGDQLTLTMVGILPDEAEADAAAKKLASNLGVICGVVGEMKPEGNPLTGAWQAMLQGLKMECQGRTIRLTTVVPDAMLEYPKAKMEHRGRMDE